MILDRGEALEGAGSARAGLGANASFLRDAFMAPGSGAEEWWWARWFAAAEHLDAQDFLLVADPDTYVFPSCLDVPLSVLPAGDVVMRAARSDEDVNNGVVLLRRGGVARRFLDALLEKRSWPVARAGGGGWCMSAGGVFACVVVIASGSHPRFSGNAVEILLYVLPKCLQEIMNYHLSAQP